MLGDVVKMDLVVSVDGNRVQGCSANEGQREIKFYYPKL